ncbi:SAF domain-containing protein [Oerskovia sp. USHLN155]|uniref:SAF domain-containing protein n=1 Tax=Oerskovia sp. USHLN155 TaxID=3081288 RepID=UPI003017B273
MRRRPALAIAALVAAVLGALGIAWLWTSSNEATQVIVVTADVPRGAAIQASDLATARVTLDPLLAPIPAARADELVGQRASAPLTAGTLMTESMVEPETLPGEGASLVPVALPPEQALGLDLEVGDRVKVVMTTPSGQEAGGNPPFTSAEVAGVTASPDTGTTVVSLLVPDVDGPVLADRVAAGNFYLVLDSREVD